MQAFVGRHWQYILYVVKHKWYVFRACVQLGVPLWIAILHDLDKLLPDEWLPYSRTHFAPDGTKQYHENVEFTRAWMKHQHRNKHHWQYWLNADGTPLSRTTILVREKGAASIIIGDTIQDWHGEISVREPIPDVYRREMLADWRGVGISLGQPDTLRWYAQAKDTMLLHPETRAWVEEQIGYQG